jgi:GDP-4-dehydro-6-deoxy-D-mannose reductase
MTKVLITGVTAFAGSHLADYLLDNVGGIEVHGIRRPRSRDEFVREGVEYHEADVTDYIGIMQVVEAIKPDFIFHLAAQSFVPLSWQAPGATLSTNILGTLNILEAVKGRCDAVVHVAGSSEEYGLVHDNETPIIESNPLRPQSPYGVSKVAADLLSQQYYKSYGIKTIVTRGFNHSGARRGASFVTSNFARQIVMIERGAEPIIKVGDLTAQRDWTDVRDIVRGYWMIANKGKYGDVYNICSGVTWSVKTMLDILLAFSTVKGIKVIQDESRMRPSDVPVLLGDCSKLRKVIDWKPEITFPQMLESLLNYWRQKIG